MHSPRGVPIACALLMFLAVPAFAQRAEAAGTTDGRIFYSVGPVLPDPDPEAGSQVYSVRPDGSDVRQLTHVPAPGQAGDPAVSPDGKRVLYVADPNGQYQVWVMTASGRGAHRLVVDPGFDAFVPRWSPDGSRLLFTRCSYPSGALECAIATADADGSNVQTLTRGRWDDFSADWSPDGSTIAFSSNRGGFEAAIWTVPSAGGTPHRITSPNREAFWPDYRPDGQRILFGNNFGRPHTDAFSMAPDGTSVRQLTHLPDEDQNGFVRYSPDGTMLVGDYFNGEQDWLATMDADGSNLQLIVPVDSFPLADWAVAA